MLSIIKYQSADFMKSILITPDSEEDYKFLQDLLKKLGYNPHVMYDNDKEELGLLKAMLKEKKGEYVSEEEVNKALGKK